MVGACGGGAGVRPRIELKYVVYLSYIILITFSYRVFISHLFETFARNHTNL